MTATDEGRHRFVLGHRAELDGLRAIAVGLVLVQHVGDLLVERQPSFIGGSLLPAGFLGVDLFFVISGFLITTLLLEERGRTGRVSLRRFYARRALRLLPPLFATLAGTVAYVALTEHSLRAHLRGVAAAVLYVWNWVVAFGHDVGDFGMGHLWSLSIEEQFYVVWPTLLVVTLLLFRRTPWALGALCAGVVAAGLLARARLVGLGALADAYVRTDSRLDGLMLGAAVAVWFQAGGRGSDRVARLAPLALVGLVAMSLTLHVTDRGLYQWGFPAASLLSGVLVVGAMHGSALTRLLSHPAAAAVGVSSYALYLVHYPVFQAVGEQLDGASTPIRVVVGVGLAAALTAALHLLVERPALRVKDRFRVRSAAAGGPDRAAPTT